MPLFASFLGSFANTDEESDQQQASSILADISYMLDDHLPGIVDDSSYTNHTTFENILLSEKAH